MTQLEKLNVKYLKIKLKYLKLFCEKQNIEFTDCYFIGNNIISIFDQYYFSLEDIILDLESDQKPGMILTWQDESVDHMLFNNKSRITYADYITGARYSNIS
jgi:hypothetical protein